MLFIFFISISQAIHVLDEQAEPTPVPISVGIDQMNASYSGCNTDLPCNTTIISPECGQKCWATSATNYFEYTFKGEKYQVYASKQPNNGNFSILLDGEVVETIDSKLSPQVLRTLVYESPIIPYGYHTIRAQGLGPTFEIYKFTYWPSVKAKRLNSSEISSIGNWQLEPDQIGGTREWVNNIDATKQVTLPCSKVWVYGCKDFNYGYMNITFNGVENSINENARPRENGVLLFESDELPYKEYPLSIKNGKIGDQIILSLYCIYYLDDPPLQTLAPFPSRSHVPDTSEDYINKQFVDSVPNNKIQASDTVKQVSGCTFTNVMTAETIITAFQKKLEFYDNTFIYTEEMENPSVLFVRYDYSQFHEAFKVTHCTFINMRHSYRDIEGIILAVNVDAHIIFESCTFKNIGKGSSQVYLKINGAGSHLEIIDSSFTLDDCERGCILCNFKLSDVLIDRCTFTRPPNNMINFLTSCSAGTFTFTNNIVQENKKTFINAPNMKNKPIINNNIFQNIEMTSGYLISYVHNVNEIELINNTFSHVTGKSLYCGGISSWYQNNQNNDMTIIYDNCKFYDCSNANTESPSNQGGAIQYGHSTSIMNTFLKFIDCEFKRNSCPNGMGGALGININRNLEIKRCLFEDNIASDKGGAIYIWGKLAKPEGNNNAPDPPASLQMESIIITECQFIRNKGSDGNAIYVEEENIASVTFTITSCNFTNNGETNMQFMIVNHCGTFVFDDNNVDYTDASKTSGALSLKNSNTVTLTNSNFKNCIVNADATVNFVNQNENSVTTISNCNLHNCKANDFSVKMTGGISNVDSCKISFDNAENACGAIYFGPKGFTIQYSHIIKTNAEGSLRFVQSTTDPVKVNNCYFDACIGPNTRCFNLNVKTTDFTFSDNVIENMVESGKKGYFGLIDGTDYSLKNLVLQNITFRNNACNSDYGGGSGLWLSKINTIKFDGCTFINNIAKKSPFSRDQKPDGKTYFTGDGGGIQYGYTASISNVDMIFTNCLFRENKAVRHGGAIALQTIKTVEIINCVFENNIANYEVESSDLLAINNYYDLKKEGRGGAIYLNPSFSFGGNDYKMISAKIEGCTFIQNKAYDGYAIYIEGDDHGTTFVVNQNTFTDNYNENTLSQEKSVISSEIYNIYEGKVVDSNIFNYTDPDIFLEPLLYANHSGIPPPTPSSSPFKTGADIDSNLVDTSNQNTIQFECPVDRGSIKVSLSCSTCSIKTEIYFIVNFEEQKIMNVEFDPRAIYDDKTIEYFVGNSVNYDKENNRLLFNSGSKYILFEKDKTENNLKCYIPFSDVIFEDKDCSANKRCEQIINEPRPVHVFVEVSKFNNFNKTLDDGGAIHLIDCCLTCDETPFTNCESKNGGGGAIYIKNDLDYTNNVTLTNIVFTECKAQYGGAVFIHCSSDRVPITITKCKFIKNEIVNNNDGKAKGSALFLNVKKSIVKRCKFSNNKGGDCSFAITSEFDESKYAKILNHVDSKNYDSFLISECKFVVVKSSKSSIKIFIKNNQPHFDINKCTFTGDLSEGSYHIEKEINEKKPLSLKITSCKFSSDLKNSLKLDQNHEIYLKDSLFNYSENDDDDFNMRKDIMSSWKLISVIVLGAFSVVTIVLAFALIYLMKKKDNGNGNEHELSNVNLSLNQNLI